MLLAILLPSVSMFLNGHFLKAFICFVLHLTLIGWIPAAIWGVASLTEDRARRRQEELLRAVQRP
ncbi:MAG: YqaE/Pmp3 family membrane protein [Hymenobacter sp.]|jgi:uncharacterized membrane protein YqaE (UPF0057 family)|nr:MAG: YqaE/Pmp3 family membrane protein [Hymenobacter sp.]